MPRLGSRMTQLQLCKQGSTHSRRRAASLSSRSSGEPPALGHSWGDQVVREHPVTLGLARPPR
jgi:hypothetical protein